MNSFSNQQIIDLYQKVVKCKTNKELNNIEKAINNLDEYVIDYLNKNPKTDLRKSSLTTFNEKINEILFRKNIFFKERRNNYFMILGTFLMVVTAAISIFLSTTGN